MVWGDPVFPCLANVVRTRLSEPERSWFETTVVTEAIVDPRSFRLAFDQAPRRLGRAPIAAGSHERSRLRALGLGHVPGGWRLDEVARVAWLLGAAGALAPDALERRVETTWRHGDSLVAQAVLKALPLLPRAERFLVVALEGARSSLRIVLEALVRDNPYPATHFHDVHFNDVVVRAVAADIPPDRIPGLQGRMNPELLWLARAHVAHRRASRRSVPAALDRLAVGAGCAA